jgi:hypothetical protein
LARDIALTIHARIKAETGLTGATPVDGALSV